MAIVVDIFRFIRIWTGVSDSNDQIQLKLIRRRAIDFGRTEIWIKIDQDNERTQRKPHKT